MIRNLLIATCLAGASASALAQQQPPAPATTPDASPVRKEGNMPVPARNPSATYLMQQYGIGEADAEERVRLQLDIVELARQMEGLGDAAFTDIWVQHEPVYKIVIGFADAKDRTALLQQIDPKLRRHVLVRQTPRNAQEVESGLASIIAALRTSGISYTGGYDTPSGQFVVVVESADDLQRIRTMIPPSLRGDTRLIIGSVPRNSQSGGTPTGVQAGDYFAAGWPINRDGDGARNCTFGYRVTYGSPARKGVVTAGHCRSAGVWLWADDNWVWFDTFDPVYHRLDANYDYMVLDATGLNPERDVAYGVYYEDLNSIPEFPSYGYFDVVGTMARSTQKIGYIMWKSGYRTGITCGEITSNNALRNGTGSGWVSVSNTKQADLSAGGDSGGPWFMYPGSKTDIYATGVHSGDAVSKSCVGTGWACTSQYMPIDKINDHVSSVTVVVKKPIVVSGS